MTRKPWTPEEIALVAEYWPRGGYRACAPHLPHRDNNSVRYMANRLGAKIVGRKDYEERPMTKFIAAAIRREYASGTPNLRALAKRIDRNTGWIKHHADVLGVRRAQGTLPHEPWNDAENAALAECLDRGVGVEQMRRRLLAIGCYRSRSAIRLQVWAVHGGFNREYYTGTETAALFGVDHSVTRRWIVSGKLRATRGPCPASEGEPNAALFYHVSPNAISAFMREHPTLWDHRKMRKEVLMDFLIGRDKAIGRLDELREARG